MTVYEVEYTAGKYTASTIVQAETLDEAQAKLEGFLSKIGVAHTIWKRKNA